MKDLELTSTDICEPLNEEAWNKLTYEAWVKKIGTPKEMAEKIKKNPEKIVSVIYKKMGDVKGKKIANLMGSNGTKAVALALLGADVTVVDFSEGNKRYGMELAEEVGVKINYCLENIIDMPESEKTADYDIVFAEMGILHYFTDLAPFFNTSYGLLKKGGKFILRDFHPVSYKLITSRGTTAKIRKHKVTGDYFSTELVESSLSLAKYSPQLAAEKVYLRKWNLGEIITAIAGENLIIKELVEEPNLSCEQFDKGIPKTFTIVSVK